MAGEYRGNVRELENTIERIVALSSDGRIDDLDLSLDANDTVATTSSGLRERVEAYERTLIQQELQRCDGNRSKAARRLGIGCVTLLDKLRKYGL